MQHDEVIWQVINHGHCTYKVKTKTQNFCRNEYNVTGLCNRSSCPLANSRYATIREENGRIYLYIKTIERAHLPSQLWQKIRLKRRYDQALEQIDEHLQYWPKFLVHKNKQRLTKITQFLIRMRKIATRSNTEMVPLATKIEKRDARREAKAERAAQLETSIEQELLQRLKQGTYGDIYNIPQSQYERVLDEQEEAEEETEKETEEEVEEYVEGDDSDEEDEEESEDEEEIEYLREDEVDFDEDSDEEDMEDMAAPDSGDDDSPEEDSDGGSEDSAEADQRPFRQKGKRRSGGVDVLPKRRKQLEIEYEEEREPLAQNQESW